MDLNSANDVFVLNRSDNSIGASVSQRAAAKDQAVSAARSSRPFPATGAASRSSRIVRQPGGERQRSTCSYMIELHTGFILISLTPGRQRNRRSRHTPDTRYLGDGRYVAFVGVASNLVADDSNFSTDVFVRGRQQRH
jgi:hypothetical protein